MQTIILLSGPLGDMTPAIILFTASAAAALLLVTFPLIKVLQKRSNPLANSVRILLAFINLVVAGIFIIVDTWIASAATEDERPPVFGLSWYYRSFFRFCWCSTVFLHSGKRG